MAELTAKLIEMYQRNAIQMQTRLNVEIERTHKLEQLVKEYYGWFAHMEETCMQPCNEQFYRKQGDKIPAMQARAKALLEQEVKWT